MNNLWWAAAVALIAFFLIRKLRAPRAGVHERIQRVPLPEPELATQGRGAARPERAAADIDAPREMPPELKDFRPVRSEDLSLERQKVTFAVFRKVPRPPKLLEQLLSPDFLNSASSAQLVDLIAAEPLIAAKLLAAVNSPMYALQRPATGIEQAVIYLGVNSVRSICLQYILINSFKPEDGARVRRLDTIWRASGLASEIAQHVSQEVLLEAPGTTTSAVVLSFLGQLAIAGAAPEALLSRIPQADLLSRSRAEQQNLGLGAAEIGRLLMMEWGLPPAIVRKAADIDTILTQPADGSDPDREARLALAYFCARAGERLADGRLAQLSGLELIDEDSADFFNFRSYLGHPVIRHLDAALKSPALAARIARMLESPRL